MIGDKKAKEISERISNVRSDLDKLVADVDGANVVTRLHLRRILKPEDYALLTKAALVKKMLGSKEVS